MQPHRVASNSGVANSSAVTCVASKRSCPMQPLQRGLSFPLLKLDRFRTWRGHRLLWGILLGVVVFVAAVLWVHWDEHWFIYPEDAHFYGLTYLSEDELWP